MLAIAARMTILPQPVSRHMEEMMTIGRKKLGIEQKIDGFVAEGNDEVVEEPLNR